MSPPTSPDVVFLKNTKPVTYSDLLRFTTQGPVSRFEASSWNLPIQKKKWFYSSNFSQIRVTNLAIKSNDNYKVKVRFKVKGFVIQVNKRL